MRPSVFPAWDNQPGGAGFDEVAGQRLRLLRNSKPVNRRGWCWPPFRPSFSQCLTGLRS